MKHLILPTSGKCPPPIDRVLTHDLDDGIPVIFEIKEKKDKLFTRDGADLYVRYRLSRKKARRGGKIKVVLPNEELLYVKIEPKEVKTNYSKVIKGLGMPIPSTESDRGNLVIEFHVLKS
mmetsp:Transcript_20769/g.26191  ORF Transcript_20769/g.26191 Transcript_20769/m.26191 type:complete len:120 (+) Transcript_20769:569-928(+)